MREVLSASAYGKHRGVSHVAVLKAIKRGRLPTSAKKVGRDWEIDVEKADVEWVAHTDPSQQREQPVGEAKLAQAELFEATRAAPDEKAAPDPAAVASLTRWRTAREEFASRLAELEFRRKSGTLVSVDDAARVQFGVGREARDALYAMPGQLAPEFATMKDPRAIADRLRDAIDRALSELTKELPNEPLADAS